MGLVFPIKNWLVFGEVVFGLGLGISEILEILWKIIHFLESSEKACDFPTAGERSEPAVGKSQAFSEDSKKCIIFQSISNISEIP